MAEMSFDSGQRRLEVGLTSVVDRRVAHPMPAPSGRGPLAGCSPIVSQGRCKMVGMALQASSTPDSLTGRAEARRVRASEELDGRRGDLGQFFTPAPIAELLAQMFEPIAGTARMLDAGAGVGSLTAAVVARAAGEGWPVDLRAHAVEVDENLIPRLKETLQECEAALAGMTAELHTRDFIAWGVEQIGSSLFAQDRATFEVAILNPPYRKLNTASWERRRLTEVGIEATNLYSAFVALVLRLLGPGGQLVAITPRSFCNGPYFKAFRQELLGSAALRRIHVFESRDMAFRDADVLQENVVFHLVKGADQGDVVIASSDGGGGSVNERRVSFSTVVRPGDPNLFFHIVADESASGAAGQVDSLAGTLDRVGAAVSTGRVVDFRAREHLRMEPDEGTVPLLYPLHLRGGRVRWPAVSAKKANALIACDETRRLLLPRGNYVLVKRFSSKEERRRVVATVLQADDLDADQVAIENHVNVFHHRNAGLSLDLAWGIASYLNSTTVDVFFRQFNGHTQVNATDLRSLRYPSVDQLSALGTAARSVEHDQRVIDALVKRFVPELARA